MPTETQNRKAHERARACIDFSSGTPPYSLKDPIVFLDPKTQKPIQNPPVQKPPP
jgi:hypothetical protein